MSNDRKRLKVGLAAGITAFALLLTGCAGGGAGEKPGASGSAATVAAGVDTNTVNYALPPNSTPNWILPIGIAGKMATHNSSIAQSLWSPMMTFDGSKGEMKLDLETGIADKMDYAADGKSVTFHMRDMHWSDGTAITTRDVEFWFNLIKANKEAWGGYKEGRLPDNITNIDYTDDKTFTLTFDKVYNQDWMSSTQLTSIKPLPHHAWAKTSDEGKIGDEDRTAEGAKEIFAYLTKSSEDMASYATNPLWKTVSGPFTLGAFDNAGKTTLTKNEKYDGQDAAQVTTVNLLPFTSSDAEVNLLRSKGVDYGYIPTSLMDQKIAVRVQRLPGRPVGGLGSHLHALQLQQPEDGQHLQAALRAPGAAVRHRPAHHLQGDLEGRRKPGLRPGPAGHPVPVPLRGPEEQPVPVRHREGQEALRGPRMEAGSRRRPGVRGSRHRREPVRRRRRQGHQDGPDHDGPVRLGRGRQAVRRHAVLLPRHRRCRHVRPRPAEHRAEPHRPVRSRLGRLQLGVLLLRCRRLLVLPGLPDRRTHLRHRRLGELRQLLERRSRQAHGRRR